MIKWIRASKRSRYLFYFLVIVLVISFLLPQYENFQKSARQKEALSLLIALSSAMGAFKEVYGVYPKTLSEIGFITLPDLQYKIYIQTSDIPDDLRAQIPEENLPFVSDDDYRAVAVLPVPDFEVWIKTSQKDPYLLKTNRIERKNK